MTIEELTDIVNNCSKCSLYKTRTNCVVGDGNINSPIMLIGEAPGEQEDLQGKAFVGKSGMLLDKMLMSIGLDRSKVYICNIIKCRPPGNRNPARDEEDACMDYLREQYKIMRPKIVVLLGSVACKAVIKRDFSIMKNHGEVIKRSEVMFLPTFHPSALLRDPSKKILAWHDLQKLKRLIESHLSV
ncbi:MAG: uracil-DNA glycosylase [Christensenellales bacterium]|jgi:uracil-DNA glycosylase family 4